MQIRENCIITNSVNTALNGLRERLNPSSLTVLTDSNTYLWCYQLIKEELPEHKVITIENGEKHKNLEGAQLIWESLTTLQVDRKGLLIILGGGVLGDMGGFCAATYKRGIEFILIPTTLLSQVDASIGGKLGIDFNGFKNHIGVFREPYCTVIDPVFLKTLPPAELRSGFAEIIKHCLIADEDMWNIIRTKKTDQQNWADLISHSVSVKNRITTEDPIEKGLRKILNFGHTIGHAIETAALNSSNPILHGEAVAAGMICEAFISCHKKMISTQELSVISDYLLSIFGIYEITHSNKQLISLMLQDKKNQGKKILMALLEGIGHCKWDMETSADEINEALNYYRTLKS